MLGYLKKELAASIAKDLEDGNKFNCSVKEVTGGSGYTYGLYNAFKDFPTNYLNFLYQNFDE